MQRLGRLHVKIASIIAIAIGFASAPVAAEDVKEDLASLESSKAALAKILSKAKAEGLIVRSPEKSKIVPSPKPEPDLENMDCGAVTAFNFPASMPVPDDADITNVAANTLSRAAYYVATDYFAEAAALLRNQNDLQARLLKEIIGSLNSFPLDSPTSLLDTYQDCDVLDPWVHLANSADLTVSLSDKKLLKVVEKIEQLPPPLRENLATVIGVKSLEQGAALQGKKFWQVIQDMHSAALDEADSEGLIITPSMQYFLAKLEASKHPEKSIARLKYLSERESEFKAVAVIALKEAMATKGVKPDAELETDLEGLKQQYSASEQGRNASLALVKYSLEAKKLREAIQITSEDLAGQDDEVFKAAIDEIASFLTLDLKSDDADTTTRALNVYLMHRDLLSSCSNIEDLKSDVSQTALRLGLSEFVDEIHSGVSDSLTASAQTQIDHAAFYKSLDTLSGADADDVTLLSKQVQSAPDLLPRLIDALIDDEKLDLARRYALQLNDEDLKSAYLARLSWTNKEWPLVASQSSGAQFSPEQIKLAQVLTQAPNVKAASPKALKSTLDDFLVSVEVDLAAAQNYIQQSERPQTSEAVYE